jgi:peptidoglycan/xylan/chitin deacetylase (PgdA/CDA1 family)
MRREEILSLVKNDIINIGAHTKTHPCLSGLNLDEQKEEIVGSKRSLEKILGCDVNTFAYPYGIFNKDSVEIVRSSGFVAACTIQHGSLESNADVFKLPRCWVGNWDLTKFKASLEDFFISVSFSI